MSLKNIDLHDTKFATIPWRYQGERVAIVQPDADQLWAALKADRTLDGTDAGGKKGGQTAPAATSPGIAAEVSGDGVDVAVYNGTTTRGLASRAATALTEHGFTVTGTANAVDRDRADTVIEYGAGLRTRAETVARLFPGAELNSVPGAGVDVVLGRSYAAQGSTSASPASTPTALPTSVARDARSADDDVCSNLSYG
jgi:hypothetical protein